RQLPYDEGGLQTLALHEARGAQDSERRREIECRPFLSEIGGRQVDGDALEGKLEAGIPDGGADAIATLAYGRIGKAHRGERRQAVRDIDLHRDGGNLDALERGRAHLREHEQSLRRRAIGVNDSRRIQSLGSARRRRTSNQRITAGSRARWGDPVERGHTNPSTSRRGPPPSGCDATRTRSGRA